MSCFICPSFRDAARDCRRKKKDYIRCLETRVSVLENQNKALIEELRSLKELYCNQDACMLMCNPSIFALLCVVLYGLHLCLCLIDLA